ncbi:MAG: hypothetical protein PHW73_00700 [Atribacterota bacterium]|nr:hypothetical protein [Atribacterota bacterium]
MEYKKITISDFLPEVNGMVEILKWSKKEGETISRRDLLLQVVFDNEIFDIEPLWSGRIIKINALKDQVISPQTIIAEILFI